MVLELQEKVGKKYTVCLNGERYCRCYPKDLRELGFVEFAEGQEAELSEETLSAFERTVFLPRAKKRALLLLGKKEYTKREMEKKLFSDGYPEGVVTATLLYLGELRYIEDVSFAERYALYLLPRCSEREAYQKMQQKGFAKELIKEALAAAKETYRFEHENDAETEVIPEHEAIRTFLRKKGYRPELADEEKKKKMVMALYRKGFSLTDIRSVLGEISGEEEF